MLGGPGDFFSGFHRAEREEYVEGFVLLLLFIIESVSWGFPISFLPSLAYDPKQHISSDRRKILNFVPLLRL